MRSQSVRSKLTSKCAPRQWPRYPSKSSVSARGTGTDTSAVLRSTGVSAIWSEPLAAPHQLPPSAHCQWLTSPCSETRRYPNQPVPMVCIHSPHQWHRHLNGRQCLYKKGWSGPLVRVGVHAGIVSPSELQAAFNWPPLHALWQCLPLPSSEIRSSLGLPYFL